MTSPDIIPYPQPYPDMPRTESLAPMEMVGHDFMMIDPSASVAIDPQPMSQTTSDAYDIGQQPVAEINAGSSRFVVFGHEDGSMVFAHARRGLESSDGRAAYVVDKASVRTLSDRPLRVGRSKRPDQHDSAMSLRHFHLSVDESGKLVVTDTGSLNGTSLRFGQTDEHTAAPVSREMRKPEDIAAEFREARNSGSAALTERLLSDHPEVMMPTRAVTVGSRVFYLTDIIGQEGSYPQAVMYTKAVVDGQEQMVPRLLYKSNSDGGWRVTYGTQGQRYRKETRTISHYTQETKLVRHILDAIDAQAVVADPYGELGERIKSNFSSLGDDLDASAADTGKTEITYYESRDEATAKALESIRFLSAGDMSHQRRSDLRAEGFETVTDYFRSLDSAFGKLPGLIPDFRSPRATYRAKHTLLGPITIEEFDTQFDGRPVTWSMAHDAEGRAWVENVYFTDSSVSSYGTRSEVLNMGCVTSKPLDRSFQTDAMNPGEWIPSNISNAGTNVDITPALSNLFPVAFYRSARGVRVPEPANTAIADTWEP